MPVIRFNGSTNYNASDIARRAQGRTVFANSLAQQKNLEKNCLNRVVAGPAPATSYDGSKYTDQRVGTVFTTAEQAAEIVAASPCSTPAMAPVITYPNYELTCSDPAGIQVMATGSFTKFTFTTTSLGAGVLEFQFFYQSSYVSSQLNVLGVDSNLITVPAGIDEVRYVFKCNPINVSVACDAISKVLQWTNPYSFTNPAGSTKTLTLYPHPSGTPVTQSITAGATYTPTPSWGYDAWDISPCP